MIEITKEITVDLTRKSNTRVIFARQLDNGCRKILVGLTSNGKEYIVPEYAIATVNVLRPDGESNAFSASVTEDGRVEVTLGAWTLGVAGETKCNISLYYDGGRKLSTPDIILDVGEELYSGDDVSSDQNYSLLTSLISDCSEILEAEADRVIAEENRVGAEKLRAASEEKRITNESSRNQKESERIQREKLRSEAESGRSSAEEQRIANENDRIEAENARREVMGDLESALEHILDIEDEMSSGEIILATAYPVGSIYMSVNATDPASLFGGSWVRLKDRFLLGAGDTYGAGTEGGSADAVIVSHSHTITKLSAGNGGIASGGSTLQKGWGGEAASNIANETNYILSTAGEDGKGKNMPPYLAVYMWKREA